MALGFSCQRPSGRVIKRKEAAIRKWKQQRQPVFKDDRQRARVGRAVD